MKRRPTPDTQRSDTHAAALRAPESPVRGFLNRVLGAAPAPLDFGGLLSFCVGVASSFDIASALLKQPKPEFLTLQAESKALAAACIARFEAAGQTDADGAADSYKRSHPAWTALVEAGDREGAATHPAAAALAVELCVSVAQHKRVAVAFATDARVTMGNDEWQGVSLHEAIEMDWEGRLPPWVSHGKKALVAFRGLFECAPPEPPAPKSFEERVKGRRVFPTPGRSNFPTRLRCVVVV